MDFLRNRTFRQTLLVRQDQPVQRLVAPDRVNSLWMSANLAPAHGTPDLLTRREDSFANGAGGLVRTPNPITKAALLALARNWPCAMQFDELLAQALARLQAAGATADDSGPLGPQATLASDMLQCHISGLVELHAGPSPLVLEPGERPIASALARWQAANGRASVTTLRHEPVNVDASMGRFMQLLDGTRDRTALQDALLQSGVLDEPSGKDIRSRQRLADQVQSLLDRLGRAALLRG